MRDEVRLSYGRQLIEEDDIAAVVSCLRSPHLTQGPRVGLFEDQLKRVTKAPYSAAVASGTAALHLAARSLGIGLGDAVITSAISFAATANAMAYCGAEVYFADVEPATGLIDLDSVGQLAAKLTRSGRPVKAIAAVDLAGQPYDREKLLQLAQSYGSKIIEDCAHSLGATYYVGGQEYTVGSCSHGDAAILSFYPLKHITTGEGGAVLTQDERLHQQVIDLRSHGITKNPSRFHRSKTDPMMGPWYYEQLDLGWHYRISDMQCALGLSQLSKLPRFLDRRRTIASIYDSEFALGSLENRFVPLHRHTHATHGYHLYVVQLRRRDGESLDELAIRRRIAFEHLAHVGIDAQVHYVPIPWHPFYRERRGTIESGALPGASLYYASSLSLPIYPAMTDNDVERVVDALRRLP